MAYFSTEPASEHRNVTGENRVWDFFPFSNRTHPANRHQFAQPRRKIRPTAMKTVSGIPYWPSRDPIGEAGGENLYGFIRNVAINTWDLLGQSEVSINRVGNLPDSMGSCGVFDIGYTFELDAPAASNGWIVQQMDAQGFVFDCGGKEVGRIKVLYWEAIYVRKGQRKPDGLENGRFVDHFQSKTEHQRTRGAIAQVGYAKWFPDTQPGIGSLGNVNSAPGFPPDAKSGFFLPDEKGHVKESGGLPSTAVKPNWWDDKVEGAIRKATVRWDCCPLTTTDGCWVDGSKVYDVRSKTDIVTTESITQLDPNRSRNKSQ